MPTGRYVVLSDGGAPEGDETFRCAPGPAGWRYVSNITGAGEGAVDVVVDDRWQIVRALFRSPAGHLALERSGDRLAGGRNGEPLEFAWRSELHLDVFSPVTNLVSTKRLRGTTDIEVLYCDRDSLDFSLTSQRYESLGAEHVDTPVGRFVADRWRFTALDSGWSADLWVAGDVVVRYERLFDLVEYDAGATGLRSVAPA